MTLMWWSKCKTISWWTRSEWGRLAGHLVQALRSAGWQLSPLVAQRRFGAIKAPAALALLPSRDLCAAQLEVALGQALRHPNLVATLGHASVEIACSKVLWGGVGCAMAQWCMAGCAIGHTRLIVCRRLGVAGFYVPC
jgi:hypothetical protein